LKPDNIGGNVAISSLFDADLYCVDIESIGVVAELTSVGLIDEFDGIERPTQIGRDTEFADSAIIGLRFAPA
jgi:hypothetical protein